MIMRVIVVAWLLRSHELNCISPYNTAFGQVCLGKPIGILKWLPEIESLNGFNLHLMLILMPVPILIFMLMSSEILG